MGRSFAMGSLFQSAHMKLVQVIERNDAARTVVAELGERGIFQFRDMNSGMQFFKRTFSQEVRRCDEVCRKLLYLQRQLERAGVPIVERGDHGRSEEVLRAPLVELEDLVAQYEGDIKELAAQENALRRNHNHLREQRIVLEVCSAIYEGALGASEFTEEQRIPELAGLSPAGAGTSHDRATSPNMLSSLVANEFMSTVDTSALQYVVGMIPREKASKFERVVFRASRGNCMIHNVPVDEDDLLDSTDPTCEQTAFKNVVIIFFSGNVLKQKIAKICHFFSCVRYPLPEVRACPAASLGPLGGDLTAPTPATLHPPWSVQYPEQRRALLNTVINDLAASALLLDRATQMKRQNLDNVSHQWAEWHYTIQREKMTYNGAWGGGGMGRPLLWSQKPTHGAPPASRSRSAQHVQL